MNTEQAGLLYTYTTNPITYHLMMPAIYLMSLIACLPGQEYVLTMR